MKIAVAITNYNSWEDALACAVACVDMSAKDLTGVTVFDDCSTSPKPSLWPPEVKLVCNERNLGFARTLNIAIETTEADVVMVFDADATPLKDFTGAIFEAFSANPQLAAAALQTVDSRNRPTPCCDVFPTASSLILGQRLNARYMRFLPNRQSSVFVTTAALAIRRSMWVKIGGFDETLTWFDVDVDFSKRLLDGGYTLDVIDGVWVHHEGGGTPLGGSSRLTSWYQSRWTYLLKHKLLTLPRLMRMIIAIRLAVEISILSCLILVRHKNLGYRDKLTTRKSIWSLVTKQLKP